MRINHYIFSLVVLIIITSCKKEEPKKDYTCECTYSIAGQSYTESFSYPNTTNAIATDSCNANEAELLNAVQLLGGSASCALNN
jgi:hypothetical protein